MRARVGSTCIKRYGPRYAYTQNPDHTRWAAEVAQAEMLQADAQSRLDKQYGLDVAAHQTKVAEWEAERSSPTGRERRSRRRQTLALALPCVAAIACTLVGLAVGNQF